MSILLIGGFDYWDMRVEILEFFQGTFDFEEHFDSAEETTSVCLESWEISLADIVAGELIKVLTGNTDIR